MKVQKGKKIKKMHPLQKKKWNTRKQKRLMKRRRRRKEKRENEDITSSQEATQNMNYSSKTYLTLWNWHIRRRKKKIYSLIYLKKEKINTLKKKYWALSSNSATYILSTLLPVSGFEKQRWESWEVSEVCFGHCPNSVLRSMKTLNTGAQPSPLRFVYKFPASLHPSKLAHPVSHYLKAYSLLFITSLFNLITPT